MPDENEKHLSDFVEYLTRLTPENDRGTLAVLRRGLGYPPGQDLDMYRYVARFVPDAFRGKDREKVYYLVAALYAFHQLSTDEDLNFGSHMALAASQQKDLAATERRFVVLLNTNLADLADYMRQAISFLRANKVKINWQNLFDDLSHWDSRNKSVQRRWANSFWAYQKPVNESTTNKEN